MHTAVVDMNLNHGLVMILMVVDIIIYWYKYGCTYTTTVIGRAVRT